jgi:hypothetical protein
VFSIWWQLCVLEVAGGDHRAVDVISRQHVFGILLGLRLGAKSLLHLSGAMLACEAPQIADGNHFDRKLLRRKLNHVHMSFASVTAPQLPKTDPVIGPRNPRIRACVHSGGYQQASCPLQECPTIDSVATAHEFPLFSRRLLEG